MIDSFLFVGVAGFEPTTPCSQSRCANRTALHPETLFFFLVSFVLESGCKGRGFSCICKSFAQYFFKKTAFSSFFLFPPYYIKENRYRITTVISSMSISDVLLIRIAVYTSLLVSGRSFVPIYGFHTFSPK